MPIGVIGPASPVSMTTSMTFAVTPWTFSLQYLRVPGHVVFEPLGFGGQFLNRCRFGPVDVVNQRFPRAFHTARVQVHLCEAVDRVDRRCRVRHPGDVVRAPIAFFAGAVPLDQRTQRVRHRLGRIGNCRFEMTDDFANLRIVPAADAIDLFDDLAVLLHDARIQRVSLVEALELFGGHAGVQIVGTRQRMSRPSIGVLVVTDGSADASKNIGFSLVSS